MKLGSDDFYKAFSEKLEKNWTESRKCPICGKVAWKTAKKPAKADIWGESHAPEKKSMGFRMSNWDDKLLKYGKLFEEGLMDLSVNIPLEQALDRGWDILAQCFDPEETRLRTELLDKFWPKNKTPKDAKDKVHEE